MNKWGIQDRELGWVKENETKNQLTEKNLIQTYTAAESIALSFLRPKQRRKHAQFQDVVMGLPW